MSYRLRSECTFRSAHPAGATILKGWKSFSPGLRGTSYPGKLGQRPSTLKGLYQGREARLVVRPKCDKLRSFFGFHNRPLRRAASACVVVALGFLAVGAPVARAETLKLEAQLLWGTNDAQSPDKNHEPVAPDIEKKLRDGPFKWTHYFVVNHKRFDVPSSETRKVALSEKCEIEVKYLGQSQVEVSHFGQGKKTWHGTQPLPRGETLVLAGNAPSSTSWLIVLKRIE